MLILRREQIEAFESASRERFILETMNHLREVFPGETGPLEDRYLRAVVERGIDEAASHDITGEREVVMFIDLEIGLQFGDEYAPFRDWIRQTLENGELDQSVKMDLIYQRLQT